MEPAQREVNREVGKRLKEVRKSLACMQAEFAEALDVEVEHYRRYESGATGLSVEKLYKLYETFGISPTYLVSGDSPKEELQLDYYLDNCDEKQKNIFWDRMSDYLLKRLKTTK